MNFLKAFCLFLLWMLGNLGMSYTDVSSPIFALFLGCSTLGLLFCLMVVSDDHTTLERNGHDDEDDEEEDEDDEY